MAGVVCRFADTSSDTHRVTRGAEAAGVTIIALVLRLGRFGLIITTLLTLATTLLTFAFRFLRFGFTFRLLRFGLFFLRLFGLASWTTFRRRRRKRRRRRGGGSV